MCCEHRSDLHWFRAEQAAGIIEMREPRKRLTLAEILALVRKNPEQFPLAVRAILGAGGTEVTKPSESQTGR